MNDFGIFDENHDGIVNFEDVIMGDDTYEYLQERHHRDYDYDDYDEYDEDYDDEGFDDYDDEYDDDVDE